MWKKMVHKMVHGVRAIILKHVIFLNFSNIVVNFIK